MILSKRKLEGVYVKLRDRGGKGLKRKSVNLTLDVPRPKVIEALKRLAAEHADATPATPVSAVSGDEGGRGDEASVGTA